MNPKERLVAEIIDAIRSGNDVWLFDHIVQGPNRVKDACKLLADQRRSCSDADEAALLDSIISALENQPSS